MYWGFILKKYTFLLIILMTGCAMVEKQNQLELGYKLTEDKFKNFKRFSIPNTGSLVGTPLLTHNEAFIDIFTDVRPQQMGISLAIILHFQDWLFIKPGESLVLLVDGEKMVFNSPSGSIYNRGILKGLTGAVAGLRIREEAHYPITTEQIKKLANSKSVDVKVYGSNASIERSFDDEHISSIRSYYNKYILKNKIQSI